MVHIRYSRWDRSTRDSLDSDTVFDQLNEYMNDSGDLQQAMRRLMQKGIKRGENQTKGSMICCLKWRGKCANSTMSIASSPRWTKCRNSWSPSSTKSDIP